MRDDDETCTPLHRQRLDAVLAALRRGNARRIVDLGCGDGALLARLLEDTGVHSAVGVDADRRSLDRAEARIRGDPRVSLVQASLLHALPEVGSADAAVLVEVIEHLDPSRLHAVERRVFAEIAPRLVVITTPNADFNPLLGVPAHRRRHPEHRFEWGRMRFRAWCRAVAERNGYAASIRDVPAAHPHLGGPTQMATFERAT